MKKTQTKPNSILNFKSLNLKLPLLLSAFCFLLFSTQAQFGNIKKPTTTPATQTKTNTQPSAQGSNSSSSGSASEEVRPADVWKIFTPEEKAAFEKTIDESKRTAPKVKELCDYQRDYDHIRDWFGKSASKTVGDHQTVESAKAFKAAIEARTNENLAIFCTLFEMPNNYDCSKAIDDYDFENQRGDFPSMKQHIRQEFSNRSSSAYGKLLEELDNYQTIMNLAADLVPQGKVVHLDNGSMEITIDWEKAGILSGMVQERDGKLVFVDIWRSGLVTPLDVATFKSECIKMDIVQTLLKKDTEDPKMQRDAYWRALQVIQRYVEAQKNSMGMQQKAEAPAAKMNDATLAAKMLKSAQAKYPAMNPAKIIIVEPSWRIEKNALGVIIHRIINTKMIYKPQGESGYKMVTLSFIEPYANGSYGEVQAHGIGTDNAAVEYK